MRARSLKRDEPSLTEIIEAEEFGTFPGEAGHAILPEWDGELERTGVTASGAGRRTPGTDPAGEGFDECNPFERLAVRCATHGAGEAD